MHEGRTQTKHLPVYAGSSLKLAMSGKAPSEMSALQPYRGKPAVRNDRGDRGNVGIIEARSAPRSYPTAGGRSVMSVPTAISEMSSQIILLKGRHLASVLQECRENANIDAGWRFIWRIADDIVPTAISSLQSAYQSLRPVSGRGAEDSYEARLHKVILEGL